MRKYIRHILLLWQYKKSLNELDNLLSYIRKKRLYEEHGLTWEFLNQEENLIANKRSEYLKLYLRERAR